MHTYTERGIHATSKNLGLTKVGSNSPDAGSPVALALNASVDSIDEQMAELKARIAALETQLAAKQ